MFTNLITIAATAYITAFLIDKSLVSPSKILEVPSKVKEKVKSFYTTNINKTNKRIKRNK